MSFYEDNIENKFRFGDVIKGCINADFVFNPLILDNFNQETNIRIEIQKFNYYIILTPCCSIDNGVVLISPLQKIKSSFLKNPYFEDDLTNINRKMYPQESLSSNDWNSLSDERKNKMIGEGKAFVEYQFFIYKEHDFFEYYISRAKQIKYYMIDFNNIFKIKCEIFNNRPNNTYDISNIKILQLTPIIREELRSKLTYYYSRIPDEDRSKLLI